MHHAHLKQDLTCHIKHLKYQVCQRVWLQRSTYTLPLCDRNNLGGFDGALSQAQVASGVIITAPAIYNSSGAGPRPSVCGLAVL